MQNVKSCEASAPQHAFKHAEFKWVCRPKDGEDDAFLRQVPIRRIMFEIFRSCTEIEIINQDISILFKIKNLNIYIYIKII